MTNVLCISINLAFLLINIVLLPGAVGIDRKHKGVPFFVLFYIGLIVWQTMEISTFVIPDPWWIRYLYDLKLIAVSGVAIAFSMMIMRFFRLEKVFTKARLFLLCIIPIITTVLALTTMYHPLLRQSFEVVQLEPIMTVERTNGMWFLIHSVYCISLVVAMLIVSIVQYIKMPRVYRTGPFWLIIVLSVCISGAVLDFLKPQFKDLDFFLFSSCLAGMLFYLANIINDRSNYLFFERRQIFNYLAEAIFILDASGSVMDTNLAASQLLNSLGVTEQKPCFEKTLTDLEQSGKISMKNSKGHSGKDIYISESEFPLVYHMYKQDVEGWDSNGQTIVLTDVTRNRLTIERLSDMAGVDALTGLKNQYSYQELLRTLNQQKYLPFSIVTINICNLKELNDTIGHESSNRLLKGMAQILTEYCPENGYTARVGSHDFAMLLPNCMGTVAEELVETLHAKILESKHAGSAAVLVLSCATKNEMSTNLNLLLDKTYKKMYINKA